MGWWLPSSAGLGVSPVRHLPTVYHFSRPTVAAPTRAENRSPKTSLCDFLISHKMTDNDSMPHNPILILITKLPVVRPVDCNPKLHWLLKLHHGIIPVA